MASSALPLKVTPQTPGKSTDNSDSGDKTPQPVTKSTLNSKPTTMGLNNISSPHELTAFVETLLEQLDAKFDDMSTQILDRMSQMSSRVDALEASIQDIINGDAPQSPTPTGTPGGNIKRSDSATPNS
ncbi:heat shock factor-binding protein 1-like [Moniliophthora roreri MCA 2997]|uniref:Heat shock factor-binding protein 1-like n=2 Tax=Moniliophthora roreri TaxID=221103 RepID=V2XQC9_MONRO|nr:heat shock factor-binding protein 1-like [Moniliophthora roreri MCA 2997]KAI3615988.1 heat shock factor-binding protein 1-like [Moniliophthora roreri]